MKLLTHFKVFKIIYGVALLLGRVTFLEAVNLERNFVIRVAIFHIKNVIVFF
jgi:hypothetical protein